MNCILGRISAVKPPAVFGALQYNTRRLRACQAFLRAKMHFLLLCVRFLKSEMAPGGVPETISKIQQKTFTLNCYGQSNKYSHKSQASLVTKRGVCAFCTQACKSAAYAAKPHVFFTSGYQQAPHRGSCRSGRGRDRASARAAACAETARSARRARRRRRRAAA